MSLRALKSRGGGPAVAMVAGLAACLLSPVACATDGGSEAAPAGQQEGSGITSSSGRVYSHEDFDAIGFRTSKQYDVEGLPEAVGAWYGFWAPEGEGPMDYEVRAYRSQEDAVEYGTALADEGSGPDAVLTSNKATWVEGVRERRTTGGPGVSGGARSGHSPRYGDFMIFENLILLCEGSDSEQSLERCASIARALQEAGGG